MDIRPGLFLGTIVLVTGFLAWVKQAAQLKELEHLARSIKNGRVRHGWFPILSRAALTGEIHGLDFELRFVDRGGKHSRSICGRYWVTAPNAVGRRSRDKKD